MVSFSPLFPSLCTLFPLARQTLPERIHRNARRWEGGDDCARRKRVTAGETEGKRGPRPHSCFFIPRRVTCACKGRGHALNTVIPAWPFDVRRRTLTLQHIETQATPRGPRTRVSSVSLRPPPSSWPGECKCDCERNGEECRATWREEFGKDPWFFRSSELLHEPCTDADCSG